MSEQSENVVQLTRVCSHIDCDKAGVPQPLTAFYRWNRRQRSDHDYYCRKCRNRLALRRYQQNRGDTLGRLRQLVNDARRRAKTHNLPFELDAEWVKRSHEKLIDAGCAYCGVAFSADPPPEGHNAHPQAPSLDQFEPRAGYTRDNTWIVCRQCNIAKSSGTFADFIAHATRIAARYVGRGIA